MRIVIGADHAGFSLKEELAAQVRQLGHSVLDVGTHSSAPVDYSDYAEAVAEALVKGKADRGVLVCGSGVGASVAANKVSGIRAGLCHDTYSAHQAVEHDDMNVLVLGGRVIGPELARELLTAYLGAAFTREDRHRRRLQKVAAIEGRYLSSHTSKLGNTRPVIIPGHYDAVLLDMDGVITDTASIHTSCWKTMFDQFLRKWATQSGQAFHEFDARDYKLYVDGKPRYEGVRDFLKSREITLLEGSPRDSSSLETICGLGNRKNELVNFRLASAGATAYPGTVALILYLRRVGIKTAVVTSSENCQAVLRAARMDDLFDVRVDGHVLQQQHLAGKPAPDSFLRAAEMLRVSPQRSVVVEDAISGVAAGVKGGFGLVVGVDRTNNALELLNQGAHLVVTDLADLLTTAVETPLKPAA
jgi:beta-phosphoglucomutase family hydrolase/RpiB/LacA/LacB family sugar-phosphate isomerase